MGKKRLSEFKKKLREAYLQDPQGYDQWKACLYQEPDGFLQNCTRNFELLKSCIPKELSHCIEKGNFLKFIWYVIKWFRSNTYRQEFQNQILENIKQSMTLGQGQTFYMYHWMLNENGDTELSRLLSEKLNKQVFGEYAIPVTQIMFSNVVRVSIEQNITPKTNWKKELPNYHDTDIRNAIKGTLARIPSANHGRNIENYDLGELLIGNKQALLELIEDWVSHRKSDTELGCVLYALMKADCISKSCKYTPFHRALQAEFPDANIGEADCPRDLFGILLRFGFKEINKRQRNKLEAAYNHYYNLFKQVNS